MRHWFGGSREHGTDPVLDRAIAQMKSSISPERLSDDVRHRILREAAAALEVQPVPTRLRAAAWRVLAGALPVAAVGLLALVLAGRSGGKGEPALRIRATKAGDEVIFSIANGKNTHRVYKLNSANGFGDSSRIPVHAGSFRDSVDDGSGLVFYRID